MEENIKCSQCNSTFNRMFLLGKQGNFDTCPVCGGKMSDVFEEDEHKDWITWYYYGFKSNNGKTTCLDFEPIDLEKHGDTFFLIKEFKAPPENNPGGLEAVKEILRTYVPDAFMYPEDKTPIVRCPKCGSKEYTLLNKGYSLFTGFLGSGRIKRVCNYCKKEF